MVLEAEKSTICLLSAREPGKSVVIQSKVKGLRVEADGVSPARDESKSPRTRNADVLGREKMMPQLRLRDRQLALPLPYCSIRTLNRLADAHPHWGGHLLSPFNSNTNLSLK